MEVSLQIAPIVCGPTLAPVYYATISRESPLALHVGFLPGLIERNNDVSNYLPAPLEKSSTSGVSERGRRYPWSSVIVRSDPVGTEPVRKTSGIYSTTVGLVT